MPGAEDLTSLLEQGARLYAAGQTAAAARVYRRAQAVAPGDPTVRLRLAMSIWHGENRGEEALAEVRAIAREYPQSAVVGAEATILNSLGRFTEAADAARRALALDRANAGAWVDLATAAGPDMAAAVLADIDTALADDAIAEGGLRQAHLARARLLRKLGRHDEAFEATAASNAEVSPRWDAVRESRFAELLRSIFTQDMMQRCMGQGHEDGRMIIILGMPRSGTTLLERLLAAHPVIATAGETPLAGSLFTQLYEQAGQDAGRVRSLLGPSTLRAMGAAYLQGIDGRMGDSQAVRVIDKMPGNHLFAPLLRLMFPRAVIVHMRRHPLDTALSCWEAGFSFGLDYASRLDLLGAAYRLYADVIADWAALPGLDMHEVRYEHLVSDPESVLRGLLRAADVDWDPACLAPAGGGQIKTASLEQARRPVSTASVGRWRRHADRLAPLIRAMGGMEWIERYVGERHD